MEVEGSSWTSTAFGGNGSRAEITLRVMAPGAWLATVRFKSRCNRAGGFITASSMVLLVIAKRVTGAP